MKITIQMIKCSLFLSLIFSTLLSGADNKTMLSGYWDNQFDIHGLDDVVFALGVTQNKVYAGGDFQNAGSTPANRIAVWDGTGWSALGTGCDNRVRKITTDGSSIYVGGHFTTVGGITVNYIARWDGSTWHALGTGVDGPVYDIVIDGNDVYVGGRFDHAGGNPAKNIARWDGAAWHAVDGGIDTDISGSEATVWDILLYEDKLYVGGEFHLAGAVNVYNIAYWDGSLWHAMGYGATAYDYDRGYFEEQHIRSLSAGEGMIYAGSTAAHLAQEYFDGNDVYFIYYADLYRWNGTAWNSLGRAIDGQYGQTILHSLDTYNGSVFTGGEFKAGNVLVGDYSSVAYEVTPDINTNGVARWTGSNWDTLDSGVNGIVYDIDIRTGEVWVGGQFTTAGGNTSYNIGRYIFDDTYPDLTLIRVPFDRRTIQDAIDIATDGDTILVSAGDYDIDESIVNDRVNNLRLISSGKSKASVIDASHSPFSGTFCGITLQGVSGCTISGFEIKNALSGISLDGCNECQIIQNYIHDNDQATSFHGNGIQIFNSKNIDVTYNIIDHNEFHAIQLAYGTDNINIINNTILNTYTYDGISLDGPFANNITIKNNIIAHNAQEGIEITVTPVNLLNDYNCFWLNGNPPIATGYTIGSHSIIIDPLLESNYYLNPESPCLGTGEGGQNIGALGIRTTDPDWDTTIPGTDGTIYAVAYQGDYIWIGGAFTTAGSVTCNHVARWSLGGNTWETLGTGTDGPVEALILNEDNTGIYVGGTFATAGGTTVNNVAYWSGSTGWQPLAGGVTGNSGEVTHIAKTENYIYIYGSFDNAGGHALTNLARYDLAVSDWETVPGFESTSYKVIYDMMGETDHLTIVDWGIVKCLDETTSSWSYYDSTAMMTGTIEIEPPANLCYHGENLMLGAGRLTADPYEHDICYNAHLYSYDGSAWSKITTNGVSHSGHFGPWAEFRKLLSVGDTLFIGGCFIEDTILPTDVLANNITVWDGTGFSPLGSGTNGTVYDMVCQDNYVVVVGSFTEAGAKTANHLARYQLNELTGIDIDRNTSSSVPTRIELLQNYPNPFNPVTTIAYRLPRANLVTLSIYNMRGETIKVFTKTHKPAGHYKTDWDGKDNKGNLVASGIYFYQIKTDRFTQTRKMLLIR